MTTVFIIGGFNLKYSAASPEVYKHLKKGIVTQNLNIVPVDISWRQKTIDQYLNEFLKIYEEDKTETNFIIGNSFGAVITLLSAPISRPDYLYICSLSPFFKEDRGKQPDDFGIKIFGKRRMENLWSYSSRTFAERIEKSQTKVRVFYGEKEHKTSPNLVNRCIDTANHIKGSMLIEVKNAPHDMDDITYSDGIIKQVGSDK